MHRNVESKTKWHSLVKRALSRERRYNRILPKEWEGFSNLEIDTLLQLEDEEIPIESITANFNLSKLLTDGSETFLIQCLYTNIGSNKKLFEDKFLPMFYLVDELVESGGVKFTNKKNILQSLLLYAVQKENAEALKTLLSIINLNVGNQIPACPDEGITRSGIEETECGTKSASYLEDNNEALLIACSKNNYPMVQLLVSAGYR